jgi:hypothetical protein
VAHADAYTTFVQAKRTAAARKYLTQKEGGEGGDANIGMQPYRCVSYLGLPHARSFSTFPTQPCSRQRYTSCQHTAATSEIDKTSMHAYMCVTQCAGGFTHPGCSSSSRQSPCGWCPSTWSVHLWHRSSHQLQC